MSDKTGPATQQQLIAAFISILRARVTQEIETTAGTLAAPDPLKVQPWLQMLAKASKAEKAAVTTSLTSDMQLNDGAQQAIKAFGTETQGHVITTEEAADPKNTDWFFDSGIYSTKFWTDTVPAALKLFSLNFQAICDKIDVFAKNAPLLRKSLQNELDKGTQRVEELRMARETIAADDVLKLYLAAVVADANIAIDSARAALQANDVAALDNQWAELAKTAELKDIEYTNISNVAYYAEQKALGERMGLTAPLQLYDPLRFNALKAVLKGQAGFPQWFNAFAGYYRGAAYALAPLSEARIRTFLDLFCGPDSGNTFTAQFTTTLKPADTHWTVLRDCVAAAVVNFAAYDSKALTKAKRNESLALSLQPVNTRVTPPANVVAHGWRSVNSVLYPLGFGTPQFDTDQNCLRHVVDETGPAPNVAKLNQYFAECVLACTAARNAPGGYLSEQRLGWRARWTIHVRQVSGRPEVYHVDSGYAQSPWFLLPNP